MGEQGQEGASLVERAKDEIRAYVASIRSPDSARWKAYADHVDYLEAERQVLYMPYRPDKSGLSYPELQLGLIEETIRQRINNVPNYKREYDHIVELVEQLNLAQHEESPPGSKMSNPAEMLLSTVQHMTAKKARVVETLLNQPPAAEHT
jgi:hypothetical protein